MAKLRREAGLALAALRAEAECGDPDRVQAFCTGAAALLESLRKKGGGARYAELDVGGGLTLPTMVLPEACARPDEVLRAIRGPMLCYVPAWGHFAFRFGGFLFHSGLGRVVQGGRCEATRPCREGARCAAPACTYYHDPAATAEAGVPPHACAVRNFYAGDFCYRPRFAGAPGAGRRVGSGDSLAADCAALTDAEAQQFIDQAAHDIICALAVCRARAGRPPPVAPAP